jgi:putative transposase
MIAKLGIQHSILKLCQMLDVARSGYQAWRNGKSSLRKQDDLRLLAHIRAAHVRGREIYGAQKIQAELKDAGIEIGINRIKRLRKAASIRCIHKRKFKVTTDSKHKLPTAPNMLNREFNQTTAPNQVWVTDITYIPTDEGWLYLAAVKDLHTCELVGWTMDVRMTKKLVCDALRSAYWRKKPGAGLLHHSDRGSQYCSKAYRALQISFKMKTSMSRKGDCWDNAPMESFFGTLKNECLHHYKFKTRAEARKVTFEYIEVFYNRIRRHAKLKNQTPDYFAKTCMRKLEKNAA